MYLRLKVFSVTFLSLEYSFIHSPLLFFKCLTFPPSLVSNCNNVTLSCILQVDFFSRSHLPTKRFPKGKIFLRLKKKKNKLLLLILFLHFTIFSFIDSPFFLQANGPPESPAHASTPPLNLPAHNMLSNIGCRLPPYISGLLHLSKLSRGTAAARSSAEKSSGYSAKKF